MYLLMILIFVIGYVFIALEHTFKIDKAASAVLTGVLTWTALVFGKDAILGTELAHGSDLMHYVEESLLEHLGEIGEILFFLLGAMTIVELIDAHQGFRIITDRITTKNRLKLMWMLSIITFFMSAALDNLTTCIVMATLLKKLLDKKEDLWFYGGMMVVAANAGGAWSPIGDVTTIMLWIGGQVTAQNIILTVIIPSIVCMLVPLVILSFTMKGEIEKTSSSQTEIFEGYEIRPFEQKLIFWMGVLGLLFVPVFKNITHLPPYMGILLSLGVLWMTTEIIHRNKPRTDKTAVSVSDVISKIDTPSILFFLGILLAVGSLQTGGQLGAMAVALDNTFGDIYVINTLIGLLSAIVDNVPLVAGAMGMYSLDVYPQDNIFWELLAYTAGTGGSALIIGSAAGVAIMGILKIDFMWYLRRVSLLALVGYFAGILTFYLLHGSTHLPG